MATGAFEPLAQTHLSSAEVIARQQDGFDDSGADMVLRNVAVLADRLNPTIIGRLSQEAHDKLDALVFMANDLAPPPKGEPEKYNHETDDDYRYRINVWEPLHRLQQKVYKGEFDREDPREISKIKFAVEAAGRTFSDILLETSGEAVVIETERYFWGNTLAAARRAKMIAQSSKDSKQLPVLMMALGETKQDS